jgi:hypothetical protein
MYKLLFTVLLSVYLTGCVSPISLEEQVPKANYIESDKVLISIVDERKKIKEGKEETFVGVAHASFGIPVNWHVADVLATEKEDKKRTLSEWLEHRIVEGFNKKGWNVANIDLNNSATEAEINSILQDNDAATLITLTLHEWYFSINLNWVSAFNFDTDTTVAIHHINEGKLLNKHFKERDVIEESASESPQNNVMRAYRDQLQQIFNDPEVKKALSEH